MFPSWRSRVRIPYPAQEIHSRNGQLREALIWPSSFRTPKPHPKPHLRWKKWGWRRSRAGPAAARWRPPLAFLRARRSSSAAASHRLRIAARIASRRLCSAQPCAGWASLPGSTSAAADADLVRVLRDRHAQRMRDGSCTTRLVRRDLFVVPARAMGDQDRAASGRGPRPFGCTSGAACGSRAGYLADPSGAMAGVGRCHRFHRLPRSCSK